jgi:hypothetical protein
MPSAGEVVVAGPEGSKLRAWQGVTPTAAPAGAWKARGSCLVAESSGRGAQERPWWEHL